SSRPIWRDSPRRSADSDRECEDVGAARRSRRLNAWPEWQVGGKWVAVVVAAAAAWATVTVAPASAALPSNDFFWDHAPTQWGLLQVAAPGAWAVSTGTGVTIGIVDSGIDAGHQDLAGKLVGGADCIGTLGDAAACQPGGADVVGHGTHVAGIAAADTNNGLGVAGMAPGAHLLSARVVGGDGS